MHAVALCVRWRALRRLPLPARGLHMEFDQALDPRDVALDHASVIRAALIRAGKDFPHRIRPMGCSPVCAEPCLTAVDGVRALLLQQAVHAWPQRTHLSTFCVSSARGEERHRGPSIPEAVDASCHVPLDFFLR